MNRSQKQTSPQTPRCVLLPAFAALQGELDNGDLLLFGGSSRLCRRIKRLTGCKWSHLAMVARHPASGRLLLWEATGGPELPDLATHEIRPGVNLYDLEEWIRHYAEDTAIRRLHVERSEAMRAALLVFYEEVRGRPYERNRLELLRAGYDGPFGANRQADLSSIFCSELVAEAYQRMGLLPKTPPSNEYTPRDFSEQCKRPLPLLLGATLGPETLVYGPA
jgi:hypothetical protein